MANKNYLSDNGLAYLWGKIKALITGKADSATTLSGYGITDAYTKTETNAAISNAIAGISGVEFDVVQTLPQTGQAGTIYLVPNSGSAPNIYDEYIWLTTAAAYEKIGTTDIDLSPYQLSAELVAISNNDIDTICT